MGLPEVTLGLLLGAGGTQRLPRLICIEQALTMITSGPPIGAEMALEIGLTDKIVVVDDMREAGVAFAREILAQDEACRVTSEMSADVGNDEAFAAAKAMVAKSARGQIAPLKCIEAPQRYRLPRE